MALHESGEDYLEAILILREERGTVRSVDVAQHLGFSKPSVSRAMGLLKKDGMIAMDPSGYIVLTEAGQKKAQKIYERHTILTKLLVELGVDEPTAAEDACRIEHYLSDTTFEKLKAHFQKHNKS